MSSFTAINQVGPKAVKSELTYERLMATLDNNYIKVETNYADAGNQDQKKELLEAIGVAMTQAHKGRDGDKDIPTAAQLKRSLQVFIQQINERYAADTTEEEIELVSENTTKNVAVNATIKKEKSIKQEAQIEQPKKSQPRKILPARKPKTLVAIVTDLVAQLRSRKNQLHNTYDKRSKLSKAAGPIIDAAITRIEQSSTAEDAENIFAETSKAVGELVTTHKHKSKSARNKTQTPAPMSAAGASSFTNNGVIKTPMVRNKKGHGRMPLPSETIRVTTLKYSSGEQVDTQKTTPAPAAVSSQANTTAGSRAPTPNSSKRRRDEADDVVEVAVPTPKRAKSTDLTPVPYMHSNTTAVEEAFFQGFHYLAGHIPNTRLVTDLRIHVCQTLGLNDAGKLHSPRTVEAAGILVDLKNSSDEGGSSRSSLGSSSKVSVGSASKGAGDAGHGVAQTGPRGVSHRASTQLIEVLSDGSGADVGNVNGNDNGNDVEMSDREDVVKSNRKGGKDRESDKENN